MLDELATYELRHFIAFGPDAYEALFAAQNEAWFPWQIAAWAVVATVVTLRWRAGDRRWLVAALALAWVGVAVDFFFVRYVELLWAAPYVGGAFALQAVLLGVGAATGQLAPDRAGWRGPFGLAVAALGAIALPALYVAVRRDPTAVEVIGLAPDPTVVVTAAVLLVSRARWWFWPIPLAWALVTAATQQVLENPLWTVVPTAVVLCAVASVFAPNAQGPSEG